MLRRCRRGMKRRHGGKRISRPFSTVRAAVDTDMSGQDLLDICLSIEKELGRVRHEKWGARVIDIDLVYSPDERSCTETLKLPILICWNGPLYSCRCGILRRIWCWKERPLTSG